MNVRFTHLSIAALAAAAAFSSCNEELELVAGTSTDAQSKDLLESKIAAFDQAFIEHFGEPDPNHAWGTDKMLAPMFPNITRAAGVVEVNRNQWCEIDGTTGSGTTLAVTYKPDALINRVKVPGWPNNDGYFYTSDGAGALQHIYNLTDVATKKPQPVGDVTDYEVQYVSTWFRTHHNPQKTQLHLTDFFVQNVSCDNDQLWYDNSVEGYTNDLGGMDAPGYNGPNAIHVADVLGQTGNNPLSYSGHTLAPKVTRLDQDKNSNEELNYRMDYLHFGRVGTGESPSRFDGVGDDWTHINNFNRGNSNYNPEENNDNGFREIKYVHSSGTENFCCRPSMGTERNWITDWVLVRLDWKETMADGLIHDRYGYYLGFDFSTKSGSTEVKPDGYYSNWIIKITPAYLNPGEHSARVMCEDLGGSFDFDFNDVVFDVAWDNITNENIICLQAAGGTLPLYVGTKDNAFYEAHSLLGQTDLVPTNVVPNGAKHEVAIYRIPCVYEGGVRNDYKMPIYVKQDGQFVNVNTNIPEKDDYEWNVDDADQNEGHYEKTGDKTPRKFVTNVGVKWPIELAGIDVAYNRFYEWVKYAGFKYEDLNHNGDLYWYNAEGDRNKIYDYDNKQVVSINGTSTSTIKEWQTINVIGIADNFDNEGLATEIVSFGKYPSDLPNPLYQQIEAKGNDKEQITFAYIMKCNDDAVVPAGVMIPVWVEGTKAYFIDQFRNKTQITSTMVSQNIYTNATLQPNFTQNKHDSRTPTTEQLSVGKDCQGYKTYINKFSFEAKDLYYKDGETKVWADYIMFFCKQKYDQAGSTNYNAGSLEKYSNPAKTDGSVIWYETYAIL